MLQFNQNARAEKEVLRSLEDNQVVVQACYTPHQEKNGTSVLPVCNLVGVEEVEPTCDVTEDMATPTVPAQVHIPVIAQGFPQIAACASNNLTQERPRPLSYQSQPLKQL